MVEMAVRSNFRGDLDSACMHNWGCVDDVITMNFDCVNIDNLQVFLIENTTRDSFG